MSDRRTFMSKIAACGVVATTATGARCQQASSPDKPALHDVRAFGARGDGVTDDTAAFNAATKAGSSAADAAGIGIYVPPGTYRIDGTVFLRKGQSLLGAGDATIIDASRARGRTIVLGRDGRDIDDPGGAPASIARLRFLGGSGRKPLIQATLPGFGISDLFISAAGTAIEINGADGIISNIVIDQALNGLVLRGARNVIVNNIVTYDANQAITIDSGTGDVSFSSMILAYSKFASMLFSDKATNITSVRVSDTTFVSSIEYPSFIGHVHARSSGFDAQFADCTFRNWHDFAVVHAAGSGGDMAFSHCTFDGARSDPRYNASASASGVRTGVGSRIRLNQCTFRRLHGPVVSIAAGLRELTINGGLVDQCRGDPIRFEAPAAGRLRVRDVMGFGRHLDQDATTSLVLPWSGMTTAWRVSASRRGSPGGITTAIVTACEKDGTVACTLGDVQRFGEPMSIACGFGAGPGGARQVRFGQGNGFLCVTVPARDIDWTAETIG